MFEITSSANQKYKYIKSLKDKKSRKVHGEYTVEGIKSVTGAVLAEKEISLIAVSDKFFSENDFPYPENIPLYKIGTNIFDKLCETKTPQGIIAVIKEDNHTDFLPNPTRAYVYCDGISDPGNLGTIIRTADAAGFGGVIMSQDCAGLYSPKVVRASMGSFFNIPLIPGQNEETLMDLKTAGFTLYGGALSEDSLFYKAADFTVPSVIIVGNEANGIRESVLGLCKKIKIPVRGGAESLNAAVAAAILMYELVSQRS